MNDATKAAIKALAKNDPTITPTELSAILGASKTKPGADVDTVVSAQEAGKILGKSPRVLRIYAKRGLLRRVWPKGFGRSIGYSRQSIMEFMNRDNWEVAKDEAIV